MTPYESPEVVDDEDSILTTIKKLLGITKETTVFDTDVIVFINSALLQLRQLGVGPEGGYSIQDVNNTWSELIDEEDKLEAAKTYIYTRVRLLFDPPTSSAAQEAMNKISEEIGWRLFVQTDPIRDR